MSVACSAAKVGGDLQIIGDILIVPLLWLSFYRVNEIHVSRRTVVWIGGGIIGLLSLSPCLVVHIILCIYVYLPSRPEAS